MHTFQRARQRLLGSPRLPAAGIALTLLILAGTVGYVTFQLRAKVRAQIVSRDAEILYGVAQMVQATHALDMTLGSQLEHLPDQFAVALQISELNQSNGVVATRIFDAAGRFAIALPAHVAEQELPAEELHLLQQLRPVSRFQARARLTDLFVDGTAPLLRDRTGPLLNVFIPLHHQGEAHLLGVVQFIMDGRLVAARFVALDRNLLLQAGLVFGVSSLIVAAVLSWAFHRLQRSNRLLLDRTRRLLAANQELALSAKTSAVGAITAHLVHGLSNPLAGLEEMVAAQREDASGTEWKDAVTTTRKVKEMIADVLRILGEEHTAEHYEFSFDEVAQLARDKIQPAAADAGVTFHTEVVASGRLTNREANLTLLILENLLRNAIQATPTAGQVHLRIVREDGQVTMEVHDQGTGLSADVQARLFLPRASTKRGGHGIGLAICKQLANHLEATLTLQSTAETGSIFVLRLPRSRLAGEHPLDPAPEME